MTDTHGDVDDQCVGIGDDGVGHQTVGTDTAENGMVKEKDHQTVAQLRQTVGNADGQQTAVDLPVHTETHRTEGAVLAEEMGQIDDAGEKLAHTGGRCRAPNAHVPVEYGQIVQHTVGNAAHTNGKKSQTGTAVGFHQHFQIIGDHEAHGEGSEALEIRNGILQCGFVGAQQQSKGFGEHQHQDGDGDANDRQSYQILGKELVGALGVLLSQEEGDDGGGAHCKDHCNGKQEIDERHGQIHGAHGVLTHAAGHKQAVHNGVKGKDHEGGHCGRGEAEKLLE